MTVQYKICIIKQAIQRINNYEQWRFLAKALDRLQNNQKWKQTAHSSLYNAQKIQNIIQKLRYLRSQRDTAQLIYTIRAELIKNKANSANPLLYQRVHYGTKHLVLQYYQQVIKGLLFIATSKQLSLSKKIQFFTEARHSYGRTALMLSGGAALGVHHIGLIKTLNQHDLLPRVICGSSAGSIVACFLCTRPIQELQKMIKPNGIKFDMMEYQDQNSLTKETSISNAFTILYSYLKRGHILKIEKLIKFMKTNIGDITFQQAFDRTGWVLNISVCGENQQDDSMILNYLTAPNILIWSACAASCAVPHIFKAVQLMCKNSRGDIVEYGAKFVDGSVWQDLPLERMSQLFNINTFIVSQVNPYVIPFIAGSDGGGVLGRGYRDTWLTNLKQFFYEQTVHRIRQMERIINPPTILKRMFNIFRQNYHGTVTISPNPRMSDYAQLLSNPTPRMVQDAILEMSRRTYQKIALIRGVYGLERQLDRFYQNLKQQFRALQMHQQRKRKKIKKGLNMRKTVTIFQEYEKQNQEDQQLDLKQMQKLQDDIQNEIQQNARNQCLLSLHKNYFLRFQVRYRKVQVNKVLLRKLYQQDTSSTLQPQNFDYLISQEVEQQQQYPHTTKYSQSYVSELDQLISNDANDSQYSCPERGLKFIKSSQNLAKIVSTVTQSNSLNEQTILPRAGGGGGVIRPRFTASNLNKKSSNNASINDMQSIISQADEFKWDYNDQDRNSQNSQSFDCYSDIKNSNKQGIQRISSYMIPRTDSSKILARSYQNQREASQRKKSIVVVGDENDNTRHKFQNKNKIKQFLFNSAQK